MTRDSDSEIQKKCHESPGRDFHCHGDWHAGPRLGYSHASVAVTEINIGNVLQQEGDNENALFLCQKALDSSSGLGPF